MDLRLPAGYFFSGVGLLLVIMGFVASSRAPLTDANVNLYSGIAMLVFGLIMLGAAYKK